MTQRRRDTQRSRNQSFLFPLSIFLCLLASCAHGPKTEPVALLYVQDGSVLELDPEHTLAKSALARLKLKPGAVDTSKNGNPG